MKIPRIFSRNHAGTAELEHLRAENARLRVENAEALELILQKQARIKELESKRNPRMPKRNSRGQFA